MIHLCSKQESLPLQVSTLTAKLPDTLHENFAAVYLPVMVTHVTITARENKTIPLRLNPPHPPGILHSVTA